MSGAASPLVLVDGCSMAPGENTATRPEINNLGCEL
jgi:hypothetical protein